VLNSVNKEECSRKLVLESSSVSVEVEIFIQINS